MEQNYVTVTLCTPEGHKHRELVLIFMDQHTSSVFTYIGALGTPSRTGPLARKYLPGFPYS